MSEYTPFRFGSNLSVEELNKIIDGNSIVNAKYVLSNATGIYSVLNDPSICHSMAQRISLATQRVLVDCITRKKNAVDISALYNMETPNEYIFRTSVGFVGFNYVGGFQNEYVKFLSYIPSMNEILEIEKRVEKFGKEVQEWNVVVITEPELSPGYNTGFCFSKVKEPIGVNQFLSRYGVNYSPFETKEKLRKTLFSPIEWRVKENLLDSYE